MDKAEFNKKYEALYSEFIKEYKKRNESQFHELADSAKKNIKEKNSPIDLFTTALDLITGFNKINRDYTKHLIYFMLENFMTDTDKGK